RGIVENPVYLGQARSGQFTKEKAHDVLVDPDTWAAAQTKRAKPHNGFGGALLSSIVRCGGCGGPLKADSMRDRDGTKLRLYRCRGESSRGRCAAPASILGRV